MKAVTFRDYVEDIQQGKAGYALGFDEMLTRYPEIYPSLGLEQLQAGLGMNGCLKMSCSYVYLQIQCFNKYFFL